MADGDDGARVIRNARRDRARIRFRCRARITGGEVDHDKVAAAELQFWPKQVLTPGAVIFAVNQDEAEHAGQPCACWSLLIRSRRTSFSKLERTQVRKPGIGCLGCQ